MKATDRACVVAWWWRKRRRKCHKITCPDQSPVTATPNLFRAWCAILPPVTMHLVYSRWVLLHEEILSKLDLYRNRFRVLHHSRIQVGSITAINGFVCLQPWTLSEGRLSHCSPFLLLAGELHQGFYGPNEPTESHLRGFHLYHASLTSGSIYSTLLLVILRRFSKNEPESLKEVLQIAQVESLYTASARCVFTTIYISISGSLAWNAAHMSIYRTHSPSPFSSPDRIGNNILIYNTSDRSGAICYWHKVIILTHECSWLDDIVNYYSFSLAAWADHSLDYIERIVCDSMWIYLLYRELCHRSRIRVLNKGLKTWKPISVRRRKG
jgi:hypothetical protein